MFLYLEDGKVKVTEEGMALPEVQDLYNSDKRSASKPFFYKCMTYIYWAYKVDGEWENRPYKERRKMSASQAGVEDYKEIDEHPKVQKIIKMYKNDFLTMSERMYEGVKIKIADVIEKINEIQLTKNIKENVEVWFENPHKDGEKEKHTVRIDIDYDNSKEFESTLGIAQKLAEREQALKKTVIKERQMNRDGRRKFDRR